MLIIGSFWRILKFFLLRVSHFLRFKILRKKLRAQKLANIFFLGMCTRTKPMKTLKNVSFENKCQRWAPDRRGSYKFLQVDWLSQIHDPNATALKDRVHLLFSGDLPFGSSPVLSYTEKHCVYRTLLHVVVVKPARY